jgi:hypothetical protein
MPTLKDVLPHEFLGCEYVGTPASKFLDVEVLSKYEMASKPWPGRHRNVMNWYVLANGRAVGWNESLSHGWSFPVIRYTPES